jgi:hypothetical protein
MRMSGLESVASTTNTAGKFFDGIPALFCVGLLAATASLFVPVIHRILHRFHLEDVGT